MKNLFVMILFMALIVPFQNVKACDIKITIVGGEKESYQPGDEIVVKIDVVFTHRVCPEGIENTKFKYEGVKVLGATPWKETENGKFERKLKLQVLDNDGKQMLLHALRTCDKEGGTATISFTRG